MAEKAIAHQEGCPKDKARAESYTRTRRGGEGKVQSYTVKRCRDCGASSRGKPKDVEE